MGLAGSPRSRVDRFVVTSQHHAHPLTSTKALAGGIFSGGGRRAVNLTPRQHCPCDPGRLID